MQVKSSAYLASLKPLCRKLLDACLGEYAYASVLAADVDAKDYSVSRAGITLSENNRFGKRGFVVRVRTSPMYHSPGRRSPRSPERGRRHCHPWLR